MQAWVEENRRSLGVRVRVQIVIDITIGWSVLLLVKAVLSISTITETLMNILNALVLFRASLLPVPSWRRAPSSTVL